MRDAKHSLLEDILLKSGWYPGRDIRSQFVDKPLTQILPLIVLDAFAEFGDINLRSELLMDQKDISYKEEVLLSTDQFNHQSVLEYYNNYAFHGNESINTNLVIDGQAEAYYYSCLIGTQLYTLSNLLDNATMFMDKYGNVYKKNAIVELIWIAPDLLTGLKEILFGPEMYLILNEERLEWMGERGASSDFTPPINKNLNGKNPFFTKK